MFFEGHDGATSRHTPVQSGARAGPKIEWAGAVKSRSGERGLQKEAWAVSAQIFSARSGMMHKGTFPRAAIRARKRTLVHHRAETLRAEKIGALSDSVWQLEDKEV